jgi:hypothetical protein
MLTTKFLRRADGQPAAQHRDTARNRNGDETWCIYETQFESLEALRAIYGMTDTQINALEMIDGSLTYDITLDLQSSENAPLGADLFWQVTLPGEITSHNADEVDGNTLYLETARR